MTAYRPADPASDAEPLDIHAWVLARLDAHIAELQALRRELASRRSSGVRARWYAAAATAVTARHYAVDVGRVLRTQEEPSALP
jgi:hypothetical protein